MKLLYLYRSRTYRRGELSGSDRAVDTEGFQSRGGGNGGGVGGGGHGGRVSGGGGALSGGDGRILEDRPRRHEADVAHAAPQLSLLGQPAIRLRERPAGDPAVLHRVGRRGDALRPTASCHRIPGELT